MSMEPIRESEFLESKAAVYFLGRWPTGNNWLITRRDSADGSRSSLSMSEPDARALWAECVDGPRCGECNAPIAFDRNYGTAADKARRLTDRLCFSCDHWRERIKGGTHVVVIDGYRYSISPDLPPRSRDCAGHGGARFVIRFHDGREVVTHNLWANGRVPDHFRDRIVDNAVFVQAPQQSGYVGAGSANGAVAK